MSRKIIEIQCKKCGEKYDSNYKSCPSCGFNPTKHLFKVVGIVLLIFMVVATFANTIYLSIKVNDLEGELAAISVDMQQSTETSSSIDLMSQSYYATYEITDDTYEETANALDSYIIYFHQEDCAYCAEANVFIDQYVNLGYAGYLPVLFVTPDSGEGLFNKYDIESTPSAVYVKDKELVGTYEGADDVFTLFDNIVAEANNEE